MNAHTDPPAATKPIASTPAEVRVFDVASHVRELSGAIADTVTMSPADRASVLGGLLDELDEIRDRVISAREEAYRDDAVERGAA